MARALVVALCLLLALAGCTQYQLIAPGRVDLLDKGEVTTPVAWNSLADREAIAWTRDGPLLQNLYFHLGIEDGKTLFRVLDKEKDQHPLLVLIGIEKDLLTPRFRKGMTEPEIMDMFAASWGAFLEGTAIHTDNLAPARLAGHPGLRFDYRFSAKDGIARKGFAVAAAIDDKLYLIHYFGTALHHFDKHRADAEAVIRSFTLPKTSE